MIKRIVEISNPAHLRVKHRQLVVVRQDEDDVSVPLEDLGVLILSNPAISHTQQVIAECMRENIVLVLCDARHLPCATLLPLSGHSLQQKILAQQIAATLPAKKRIWRAVVRCKILHQAKVLKKTGGAYEAELLSLQKRVQSGDPENREAQAARLYWKGLFGEKFKRFAAADGGANAFLNYGYALVRAATARAIVGGGLHPALGVHHHNQYDPLCLADDLMEPLRPFVDIAVWKICGGKGDAKIELSPQIKKELLAVLTAPCITSAGKEAMLTALHGYVASFRRCLCGEEADIRIPTLPV